MEPDKITRMYYVGVNSVREAWPKFAGFSYEWWITGEKANEIINRADFSCSSEHVSQKNKPTKYLWIIREKGKTEDEEFTIRQWKPWKTSEEIYAHLARYLEKYAHKKGLTILIH